MILVAVQEVRVVNPCHLLLESLREYNQIRYGVVFDICTREPPYCKVRRVVDPAAREVSSCDEINNPISLLRTTVRCKGYLALGTGRRSLVSLLHNFSTLGADVPVLIPGYPLSLSDRNQFVRRVSSGLVLNAGNPILGEVAWFRSPTVLDIDRPRGGDFDRSTLEGE